MTHESETHTSLPITVAREFAKNYRLLHRKTRDFRQKKYSSEETTTKDNPRTMDYSGFS
jgi:hypothetical protein